MATLTLGSRGADVKQLQEQLNKLGFDCGTPDGDFEEKTKLAVKQFQKSKGLTADGVAGIKTLAVLFPVKPMKVKAPSGVIFDIVDSELSDHERLKQFSPGQAVGDESYYLPRFYIALNSQEDLDKQLTKNFKLREFISEEEGGPDKNNLTYPYFVPVAIVRLAQALEELRTRLDNQPLKLSSGYRSPFYSDYQNNPRKASAHRFGTATDIIGVGDLVTPSQYLLNRVNEKAFDGEVTPGTRLSSPSSLGFVYAESVDEMGGSPTHAHIDMGYISGYPDEINHLGNLAIA